MRNITGDILNLINGIPEESKCGENTVLKNLCLDNPAAVAEIVFSDVDEQIKIDLISNYSKDHGSRGVLLENKPLWTKMIETFILPRLDELPIILCSYIRWYFKGKYNLPDCYPSKYDGWERERLGEIADRI